MRTLFGNIRAHLGIRSLKKKPQPPHSVRVLREEGRDPERVFGDIQNLPIVCNMPVFPTPYVLLGKPPPSRFSGYHWAPGLPTQEMLDSLGAKAIISETIRPKMLARMLAKIAHAQVVANIGAEAFVHRLVPLILGEPVRFIEYVGGTFERPEPDEDETHSLELFVLKRATDGKEFLVSQMRLFANIGAPIYIVVLGETLISRAAIIRRVAAQAR